ncbi:MAG: DUF1559 domain-containing protein, partial [Gemmatimonadales bacterium]
PWDGPNNRKLHALFPRVFRCPADPAGGSSYTSYAAVVGPNTVWPGAESRRYQDIRDGLSNTILVVEAADAEIHWMEPRDLSFDDVLGADDGERRRQIVSGHSGGTNVVFADWSVYYVLHANRPLGEITDATRALLTVDGGEAPLRDLMEAGLLSRSVPGRRPSPLAAWAKPMAWILLVGCLALLIFVPPRDSSEKPTEEPE